MKNSYDLIVVGTGAAGLIASVVAARSGKKVLLLEKLSKIASKLKATGGGRCNITNSLANEDFMARFGREGRFMQDALALLDHKKLLAFLAEIGIETHAPDGYRYFPTSHSSQTIIDGFANELQRLGVTLLCNTKVERLLSESGAIAGVETHNDTFYAPRVILATGGLGYPTLGAEGDGYLMAEQLGHTVVDLYPAMMPLLTKDRWQENCRADTIAKVELRVDLKKYKKLRAKGDLIFTKNGIRGPVVLDFAREVTPLLEKYGEVPILLNFTKGMNEEQIRTHLKKVSSLDPDSSLGKILHTLLPLSLSIELCKLAQLNAEEKYTKIEPKKRDHLIKILAWTPMTVTGHDGFKMAMITRGGISLKEIEPKTMQSKLVKGLYFCGEIIDLDGPCGGYNLQWSFASGYLAGELKN